ncbi:MAG: glycosyltransferase, partial [Methanosarcinales archaeon]
PDDIYNFQASHDAKSEGWNVTKTNYEGIEYYFICGGEYQDLEVYPSGIANKLKALEFNKYLLEFLEFFLYRKEFLDTPVVIHAHDWQSGLIIPLVKLNPKIKPTPLCAYTMHNYFRTNIQPDLFFDYFDYDWLDRYKRHEGFLNSHPNIYLDRTALYFADVCNTVSADYANSLIQNYSELRNPTLELDKPMLGILNGVNPKEHSPKAVLKLQNIMEIPKSGINDLERISNLESSKNKVQLKKDAKSLLYTLLKKWKNKEVLPKLRVGNISEIVNNLRQKDLNWNEEDTLCVFIGRIVEQKGFDILVRSIPKVTSENPRARFIFMGSGGYDRDEKNRLLYGDYPYNTNTVFLEMFSPEIRDLLYIAADIFVVPSRYEPCGLTPFEAMGTGGTPCIVNPVGGLKEIVVDNEMGVHISPKFYDDGVVKNYPGSPEESLAYAINKLIQLISDRKVYSSMITNCLKRVKEPQFSWEEVAKKYLLEFEIGMQKYMQYIFNYEDIKQEKTIWINKLKYNGILGPTQIKV